MLSNFLAGFRAAALGEGVADDTTKRSKWQSKLCHLCSDSWQKRGGDVPLHSGAYWVLIFWGRNAVFRQLRVKYALCANKTVVFTRKPRLKQRKQLKLRVKYALCAKKPVVFTIKPRLKQQKQQELRVKYAFRAAKPVVHRNSRLTAVVRGILQLSSRLGFQKQFVANLTSKILS